MRAAAYVRVSTEEQAREGYSIPAQRERLLAYARSQDWEIVEFYVDEGISAKDLHRPKLQRMLQDVRNGQIDVVLVYKLDRLTRSVLDLYKLLQEFDRCQVKFKSATEVYDTTTAIGRLFITLVAALAQWERENLGERTKLGKEEKARQGKRPGGKAPFGYEKDGENLTVNEREAHVVQSIFQLYLQHANMNTVAERLFDMGARTKNGAAFSVATLQKMLRNPLYIGTLRYNYTAQTGSVTTIKPKENWILVEEALPAILEKHVFYEVQAVMDSQSAKAPRGIVSDYVFSGLVLCPNCGSTLTGTTYRSKGKTTFGDPIRYYRCSFSKPGACHQFQIREDKLEQLFLDQLQQRAKDIRIALGKEGKKATSPSREVMVQRELDSLRQKRKRLQQLFLSEWIEIDELKEQLDTLYARQWVLEQQLAADRQTSEISIADDQLLALLQHTHEAWNDTLPSEKKQIVHILVKSICAARHPAEARGYQLRSIVFHS